MEKPINFGPDIVEELDEKCSVGDEYSIWTTDNSNLQGDVAEIVEKDNNKLISLTLGSEWPMLVLLVKEKKVLAASPEGTKPELKSCGEVDSLLRNKNSREKDYDACGKLQEWFIEGDLELSEFE